MIEPEEIDNYKKLTHGLRTRLATLEIITEHLEEDWQSIKNSNFHFSYSNQLDQNIAKLKIEFKKMLNFISTANDTATTNNVIKIITKKFNTPICSFPTTVFFIDDDASYLNEICHNLRKHFLIESFIDPAHALSELAHRHNLSDFIDNLSYFSSTEEMDGDQIIIHNSISKIHELIYSEERFKNVSVIIVDYDMPQINGIEFFRQIEKLPAIKILLTGHDDKNIAIDAFHQGLIDFYLIKKDCHHQLTSIIKNLQNKFFSKRFAVFFEVWKEKLKNVMNDFEYSKIFKELLAKINPIEFYLLNTSGSFLFLDNNANQTWFIVYSRNELDNLAETAKLAKAPNHIIQNLEEGKKIPFLITEDDYNINPINWIDCLYPAKTMNGKNIYYYSIIKNNKINLNKIFNFTCFLKHQSKVKIFE